MRTVPDELRRPSVFEPGAISNPSVLLALVASLLIAACGSDGTERSEPVDTTLADSATSSEPISMPAEITSIDTDISVLASSIDSLGRRVARIESEVDRLGSGAASDELPLLSEDPARLRSGQEGLDAQRRVQETAQDVQNFTLRAIWAAIILVAALFLIKAAVWLLGVLSERSAKRRLLFKKLI
ncbi:MAG: hypothetical protein JSW51_13415, partial [Gemmatimonadota bacterium]